MQDRCLMGGARFWAGRAAAVQPGAEAGGTGRAVCAGGGDLGGGASARTFAGAGIRVAVSGGARRDRIAGVSELPSFVAVEIAADAAAEAGTWTVAAQPFGEALAKEPSRRGYRLYRTGSVGRA